MIVIMDENVAQSNAVPPSDAPPQQQIFAPAAKDPLHANFCRISATPEEFFFDYFLSTSLFGSTSFSEAPSMLGRLVMSPEAAKRTLLSLVDTLKQYEDRFGEVHADPRQKLKTDVFS